MANANGTVNPTYPTYRSGGWTAIRMWLARSGFGPMPSVGATASPIGSHEVAEQTPLLTSVQIANGLATVAIRPNQNTATAPITARARTPRPSPALDVRARPAM